MISCTGADLGYQLAGGNTSKNEPYLQTLLEVLQIPRDEEIPVNFKTETGTCEYIASGK